MSDRFPVRRRMSELAGRHRRDEGSTLPELLITVMLMGLIMASLTSAVIVLVREQDNSKGRLNVSKAETSVGLWMPADMASAETVDVSPGASPCGTTCPPGTPLGGSNSMMLSWTSLEAGATSAVPSTVNVSYRYSQVGTDYHLLRVECTSVASGPWSCNTITVLRGLAAPPPGVSWTPGVTVPDWVIDVGQPGGTDVNGNPLPPDPNATRKNAQRVVVTINGGGDVAGAGGGLNTISLSASGTERGVINASSTSGTPTFTEARTRCGGNYGLVIDDSGSIGGAMGTVRNGVQSFIDAFAGTPIKIQVVRFDSTASVIGQNPRTRYFDMLNPVDVAELRTGVNGLNANGSTNWEDALHRMFYDANGAVAQTKPDTVIFFTDGEPTWSRVDGTSTPGAALNPPPRQPELMNTSGSYDQEAFNRAKVIVDRFRSDVKFIGVGVGPAFNNSNDWLSYGAGWHYNYFRGFHYEKRNSATSSWRTVDLAEYNSTSPVSNRRIQYSSPYQYWEPTTKSVYDTLSSSARQRQKDYTAPFDSYDVTTTRTPNSTILTRLITDTDNGIPAVSVNGAYTNADTANMYLLPNFNQFAGALEAVALAECGGTLTLQTKVGTVAAADPFTYQHTASTNSAGLPIPASLTTITTTRTVPSGTFDFTIPNGEWVTVEIQPAPTSGLTSYAPVAWSCRAGANAKAFEAIAIPGSPWTGIRVRLLANEAVSCTQTVIRI